MKQFASYLRVSTQKQGAQGLGISAQREMCERFIKQNDGEHIKEFMDVESGTHRDRKGLWDAIEYCKKNDCGLVIAKLDRLARDVEFTFKVINTGIDIHFTDMPVVNSMILGVFASVAQYEREMCSRRTKDALAAKKSQGAQLGAASEIYKANRAAKGEEALRAEARKRGAVRSKNFMERADVVAFMKVVRRVYPQYCNDEDYRLWGWSHVNSKKRNATPMLQMMKDFHEMNGSLFQSWDFSDMQTVAARQRLNRFICTIKRSMSSARYNSVSV